MQRRQDKGHRRNVALLMKIQIEIKTKRPMPLQAIQEALENIKLTLIEFEPEITAEQKDEK